MLQQINKFSIFFSSFRCEGMFWGYGFCMVIFNWVCFFLEEATFITIIDKTINRNAPNAFNTVSLATTRDVGILPDLCYLCCNMSVCYTKHVVTEPKQHSILDHGNTTV